MKKKDLILSEKKSDDVFMKKCIFDPWNKKQDIIEKLLSDATNSEEFIDSFLQTKELFYTRAYSELSKKCRPEQHWYKIREMFGDKQFKTSADAGSVKIGNDDFTILIPAGDDGVVRVAVFDDRREFNTSMMKPFTLVNGTFNIYDYDCGEVVAKKLTGKYYIYQYDGLVAFEKLS